MEILKRLILLLVIATVSLTSCSESTHDYSTDFKEGDLVYLKPDSTLVSIHNLRTNGTVDVLYMSDKMEPTIFNCKEHDLFPKTKN